MQFIEQCMHSTHCQEEAKISGRTVSCLPSHARPEQTWPTTISDVRRALQSSGRPPTSSEPDQTRPLLADPSPGPRTPPSDPPPDPGPLPRTPDLPTAPHSSTPAGHRLKHLQTPADTVYVSSVALRPAGGHLIQPGLRSANRRPEQPPAGTARDQCAANE